MHLDLDCFFVSAHRTLDKTLEGIPVAVGGRSNLSIFSNEKKNRNISSNSGAFVGNILTNEANRSFENYFTNGDGIVRGIVTTSSYEARRFGVKTAMRVSEALSLCPNLKVLPPNYPLYHDLSHKLKVLLQKEVPLIEQFSIDEFFVDLRGYKTEDEALEFAFYLKQKIKDELDLPISIGVSYTKYLSKLLTEYAKPENVKFVKKADIKDFIKDISIDDFPGIGKGFSLRLKKNGIRKLGQVEHNKELFYNWKKPGIELYNRICGENDYELKVESKKKSIGISRTFDSVNNRDEIKRRISILCRYLTFLVEKEKFNPQSYYLKFKYESNIKVKDTIRVHSTFNEFDFRKKMIEMFDRLDNHRSHGIIFLNLSVYNFIEKNNYVNNLFSLEEDKKKRDLSNQIQKLRTKYGVDILKSASEMQDIIDKKR